MDEALRRAYLAAMDIPLWIPRSEEDVFARVETAPPRELPRVPGLAERAPPVVERVATAAERAADQRPPRPAAARTAMTSAQPSAPARPSAAPGFAFGLVRSGGTLLVDEAPLSPRAADLARAICLAVERQKLPAETQDFVWPPRGAPLVAAEARDAMLARIDKLGGGGLRRLLLLGASPAGLLLGWDAGRWATRDTAPQRIDGLECEVLLLPGLVEMLGSVEAKRLAWEHLRGARVPGG